MDKYINIKKKNYIINIRQARVGDWLELVNAERPWGKAYLCAEVKQNNKGEVTEIFLQDPKSSQQWSYHQEQWYLYNENGELIKRRRTRTPRKNNYRRIIL